MGKTERAKPKGAKTKGGTGSGSASKWIAVFLVGAACLASVLWSGSEVVDDKQQADLATDIWSASKEFPLHDAAENGCSSCLDSLLGAGKLDLEERNMLGETALAVGAHYGHAEAVGRLLKAGASAIAPDDDGQTPCHAAASSGHAEAIQLFLEHDASSCTASDAQKRTPLHLAVVEGHAEVARLLGGH